MLSARRWLRAFLFLPAEFQAIRILSKRVSLDFFLPQRILAILRALLKLLLTNQPLDGVWANKPVHLSFQSAFLGKTAPATSIQSTVGSYHEHFNFFFSTKESWCSH